MQLMWAMPGGGGAGALPIVQAHGGESGHGSHQLSAVWTCPRQWWLRYRRLMLLVKENGWRMSGTLIHLALSYRYAAMMEQVPAWVHEKSLDEELEHDAEGLGDAGKARETIATVRDVMREYTWKYEGEPWVPVAVEEQISMRLGDMREARAGEDKSLDDVVVTCRPDLVVRCPDGLLRLVDHKTTSDAHWRDKDMLPDWPEDGGSYRVPWQMMLYLWIARHHMGQAEISGFVINRIKRTKGWKSGRYDMDRHELRIPVTFYEKVPEIVRATVAREREVERAVERGEKPIGLPWACHGPFGPCDYVDWCTAPTNRHRGALLGQPVLKDDDEELPEQKYKIVKRAA